MRSIPNSADILLAVNEATPDAIFVKDRDGRYVIVNEAVGQLTGGIAHDFNNILMVILGNLELLKLRLPEGDDHAVELMDETLRATRHGQDLTGDLLAFSRRRQLNPQPVGINQTGREHRPAARPHARRDHSHHDHHRPRCRRRACGSGGARGARAHQGAGRAAALEAVNVVATGSDPERGLSGSAIA